MGIRKYLMVTIGTIILLALSIFFYTASMPDGPEETGIDPPAAVQERRPSPTPTPVPAADEPQDTEETLYEAEDAVLDGLTLYTEPTEHGVTAKSGSGYVGAWDSDQSRLIFRVEAPDAGMYELMFLTAARDGESYNTVIVNDRTFYDALYTGSRDFVPSSIRANLKEGPNVIVVETGWGGIYLDCLTVRTAAGIPTDVYHVEKTLSNENASDHARRLMSFLADQYGKKTLAGQYNSDKGIDSPEIRELYKLTGKYPAIMGFEMSDYSPSRVAHGAETRQTEFALDWAEKGGIVTFVWHWNAPKDLINTSEYPWWDGYLADATTFDLKKALNGEDPEGYDLLLRDIDAIAEQLKILGDQDIPVLWRPLHEGSGGWFWWGAHGPDNYKKLWRLMYDRMTDTQALDNLIWVYNGQNADWYPGDEYVDIIAEDTYTRPRDYESQFNLFAKAAGYTGARKIIGLSENGAIPDPDLMYADNAGWSFFITWNDELVVDPDTKCISDEYNALSHFIKVYHHDRVITLDELPDLCTYPK